MPSRFGEILRQLRRKAKKTQGDVARLLNISVVYLSDVERGNRKPFSRDRILTIVEYLDADPAELMQAADRERGFIEYDIRKASPLEADVVGSLVSGLARGGVTDNQLRLIRDILEKEHGETNE